MKSAVLHPWAVTLPEEKNEAKLPFYIIIWPLSFSLVLRLGAFGWSNEMLLYLVVDGILFILKLKLPNIFVLFKSYIIPGTFSCLKLVWSILYTFPIKIQTIVLNTFFSSTTET